MYEASLALQHPERTQQPLWRYLSRERLVDLLTTGELFFSHLPKLEDQYEGVLTSRTREHLAKWFQRLNRSDLDAAYAEVAKYQEQRTNFYVNCWHMNDHESYLMWKAYSERGFAIQTTFERLQGSFDALPPAVTGGVVGYVDFARELTPVGNVFYHVATKDMPYRDEREFRLVFWTLDPRNANYPRIERGVRIRVDVGMLIGQLVMSPYCESLGSELEELLERHGLRPAGSAVYAAGGPR